MPLRNSPSKTFSFRREFATKFIINDIDTESYWKEWLAKAEKMGYKKIETAYNSAQKRYDSKN